MRNSYFRFFLSTLCLASIMIAFQSVVMAAPVQFNQVVQIINAKPGKAQTGSFSQIRLADNTIAVFNGDDGDGDEVKTKQDDRVITNTTIEIVEDCQHAK